MNNKTNKPAQFRHVSEALTSPPKFALPKRDPMRDNPQATKKLWQDLFEKNSMELSDEMLQNPFEPTSEPLNPLNKLLQDPNQPPQIQTEAAQINMTNQPTAAQIQTEKSMKVSTTSTLPSTCPNTTSSPNMTNGAEKNPAPTNSEPNPTPSCKPFARELNAQERRHMRLLAITCPSPTDNDPTLTERERYVKKMAEVQREAARFRLEGKEPQLPTLEQMEELRKFLVEDHEQLERERKAKEQAEAKMDDWEWAATLTIDERRKMLQDTDSRLFMAVANVIPHKEDLPLFRANTLKSYAIYCPQLLKNWIEDELKAIEDKRGIAAVLGVEPSDKTLPLINEVYEAFNKLSLCEGCDGSECRQKDKNFMRLEANLRGGDTTVKKELCPFGLERQVKRKAVKVGVPAQYVGKTFDDFEVSNVNSDAFELMKSFSEVNANKGLYIWGECGTGKTLLASVAAQALLRRDKTICFGEVPMLLGEIKRTFDKQTLSYDAPTEEQVIKRFITCDVLFLDDIGTGKMSDWHVNMLYTLINERYNSDRPIIVTSNYDLNGLTKRLAQGDDIAAKRIVSRLCAMCNVVYSGSRDWRRH